MLNRNALFFVKIIAKRVCISKIIFNFEFGKTNLT